MDKPREYGLVYNFDGTRHWNEMSDSSKEREMELQASDIHTIEYSAYQDLKSQLELKSYIVALKNEVLTEIESMESDDQDLQVREKEGE